MCRIDSTDRAVKKPKERGFALLMVLLMIALIGAVVAEFQYTSRIDLQIAYNARDELQAEYNALAAMRLRALLLKQAGKVGDAMKAVSSQLGDVGGALPPIGQMLEMIPVDCSFLSLVLSEASGDDMGFEDLDDLMADGSELQDMAVDELEGGFFRGGCVATSTSEHSKISLNMLRAVGNANSKEITQTLVALLSDRRYEDYFGASSGDERKAESPQELVGALVDWIDDNNDQAINSYGDEGGLYAYDDTDYRVKNAPFDSIEELRLIHGVDDRIFNLLSQNISVHSDSAQIELGSASFDTILKFGIPACFIEGATLSDFLVHPGAPQFYHNLQLLKGMGGGTLKVASLRALITETGLGNIVDVTRIDKVFSDKSSTTWFTINATGNVGRATKRISAVYQAREGRFYHIRME